VLAAATNKTANPPGPLQAPGVQTGPVLTAATNKNANTPGPLQAPGVQTGPVLAAAINKNANPPGPLQTPGVQSGPVLAAATNKNANPSGPLQAPGVQTGPVLAAATNKNANPSGPLQTPGVQSGPVQREAQSGQGRAFVAQGRILASAKPGATQGSVPAAKSTGTTGNPALASAITLPDAVAQTGKHTSKREGKIGRNVHKGGSAGHGKANAAGVRTSPNTITSGASRNGANPALAPVQDQFGPMIPQDKADASAIVHRVAAQGGETLTQAQESRAASPQVAPPDAPLRSASTQAATAAGQPLSHNAPRLDQAALAGFAASLAHRVRNGASKFTMRLDPPELGKVHIRIDVSADHKVEAIVSTHRADVLADLQRGADSLRRALVDAGFDPGSDGLNFSLDRGPQGHDASQQGPFDAPASALPGQDEAADDAVSPLLSAERGYGMMRVFSAGVDIRV